MVHVTVGSLIGRFLQIPAREFAVIKIDMVFEVKILVPLPTIEEVIMGDDPPEGVIWSRRSC